MKRKIISRYFGDKNFYKMIMAIAFPIIVQSLLTNFVGLLDNVMVGRLGTEQMTGVAVVNQLFFVFNLAVFGGMSAAGIFCAQYFGQNNHKGVRNVFRLKIIIALFLMALSVIVFTLFYQPLINVFLHADGSGDIELTYHNAKTYLFIMLVGLPPFIVSNAYGTTLKETGETVVPMFAGIMAVIVDFVFNYVLIFGAFGIPAMGVAGAAAATSLSRYVECIILVAHTHLHSEKFKFIVGAYKSLGVPAVLAGRVVRKGLPLFLNEFLWAAGLTLQTQAFSTRGLEAVAAMNINNTVSNVFNIVFVTMGTTISIVVGQLLGAGKLEEAEDTDRKMCVFSVLTAIGVSIVLFALSPVFPLLYNTTDGIRKLASSFIIVFAIVTPFNSYTNAAYFTLRSGGKTMVTFLFDSCYIWAVNVPLSMCLVHFTQFPIIMIFAIVNGCEALKAFVGFVLVKKGIWLNTIVEEN